jgi:hypothetical protein
VELAEMVVIRAWGPFGRGDTVRVDVASVSDEGEVPYYVDGGDAAAGSVPLQVLGPAGRGRMLVTASSLKIRKCRSTGCSVLGVLEGGDEIEVRDFAGRWYRLVVDGADAGYVNADYLILPTGYRWKLLGDLKAQIAAYYDRELRPLTVEGTGPVFSGYAVEADDDVLRIEFYAARAEGAALATICGAMRGIAKFVQARLAAIPGRFVPAYTAGVYVAGAGAGADDGMVAGMTGDGGVYCQSPD